MTQPTAPPRDLMADSRGRANRAAADVCSALTCVTTVVDLNRMKALLVGHFEDCRASAFAAGLMRRQMSKRGAEVGVSGDSPAEPQRACGGPTKFRTICLYPGPMSEPDGVIHIAEEGQPDRLDQRLLGELVCSYVEELEDREDIELKFTRTDMTRAEIDAIPEM